MPGPPDAFGLVNANRRSEVLVAAVAVPPALLVGALLWLVSPVAGVLGFVVVAAAVAWLVWSRSDQRVAGALGGVPADPVRQARALNLLEGLSFTAGLRPPGLQVLDSPGLNAAVFGRRPGGAMVVATSALLEELTRIELEGVLAAALVEIRNGGLGPATVVAGLPGVGRRLVSSASGRDAATDLAAVHLTRFPPGLASALDKMASKGTEVATARADQAHLWLADPMPVGAASEGRTDLHDRAEALREL